MRILVIDGMGGGIGRLIVERLKRDSFPNCTITAVGTSFAATSAMLKAGADNGATGENAVMYNCKNTDFIVGAIGIIVANSMHGEISKKIASSVSKSKAHKLLIPASKCNATVLGVQLKPVTAYLEEMVEYIKNF